MLEYEHLKSEDRNRIAELKASGPGVNAIARDLGGTNQRSAPRTEAKGGNGIDPIMIKRT